MTKEALERIKQAYYSGLKVQIWFDGYWENFDARDYSMYSDPFSENRQYRVVGSAYADIAEKQISELKDEMNYVKSIIKGLLDNSDEYARQRAIDFLKGEGEEMKLQEITLDEFNRLCPGNDKTYFSNGCIFDEENDNLIAFCWYASPTEAASKYYKVVEK